MGFSDERVQFSGTLFCLGDSHAAGDGFTGLAVKQLIKIPATPTGKGGPPHSMYVFGRDQGESFTSDLRFQSLKDGDAVLFGLGFIDVAWLLWKQVNMKHRKLDDVIEELVVKYLDVVNRITSHVNVIRIIYGVTPPIDDPTHRGPLKARVLFTKKMNEKLRLECSRRNLEYFDVYDDYCDANGILQLSVRANPADWHIEPPHNFLKLKKLEELLRKYNK